MESPFTRNEDPKDAARSEGESAQRAASDATASNRASEKYGGDPLTLYWQGIDFLEMSVPGNLDPEVVKELDRLKVAAQSPLGEIQAQAWKTLGERVFQVQDRGSGLFRFVLFDSDFYIKVRGADAKRLPMAFVQVRSQCLCRIGPIAARDEAIAICRLLGEPTGEAMVSRIDMTVDFDSDGEIDAIGRDAWVTRADYRQSHSVGDRFTGWSIGQKGPIAFRLYDKYFEVQTQSKKEYLYQVWSERGWFLGDPVWRAEFQLRRPALAQFGLDSLQAVLHALQSLWAYVTVDWLRLTIPQTSDENRARWPLHSLWEKLQNVRWDGAQISVSKIKKTSNAPTERYLLRATASVITSAMAREGIINPVEALDFLRWRLADYLIEAYTWEGAMPDQILLSEALIKERKYGTHLLSSKLKAFEDAAPKRQPGEEG